MSKQEFELTTQQFNDYMQLAASYIVQPKCFMIIMHGVSGSGKSWLSEQLMTRLHAIRIRSDAVRKRLHGLSPTQSSHTSLNSGLYSAQSSAQTYSYLLELTETIISAGYPVIADATFLKSHQRQQFYQKARQLQIPYLIVHTHTDLETLQLRVSNRINQENNISEANLAVLENQLDTLQPLNDEEREHCIAIDTGNSSDLSGLWQDLEGWINNM